MNTPERELSPAERDRLEQELLELHFGCHEDPAALEARLAAEPALRRLQQEVLGKAAVLEHAVRPEQEPIDLAGPAPALGGRRTFWRRPIPRLLVAAAAAACTVLAFFVADRIAAAKLRAHERGRLHLTVSSPKAVPAGAPWSFTVQARDLRGEPASCRLRWQAFGDADNVLAAGEAPVDGGTATIAMQPDLRVPRRIELVAVHATDEVRQVLTLSEAAAGPLVHVTTDRPVYRPGEVVFVRAVILDRVTRLPSRTEQPLAARLFDAKDAPVATQRDADTGVGVGSFALAIPEGSPGGTHRVELSSPIGAFAPESIEIVVRPFQTPRLDKQVVLDRASYAPGARGAAAVRVERLGAGPAEGASVTGTLVVDGTTVSSETKALDARGEAAFRFTVPTDVERGAARFVAVVEDGGTVESEVRPFVVPTGEVLVACFPEGGDLVAGVPNRVYVEITDPLGRPVDATAMLVDDQGERIARFTTEHQGRARVVFTPRAGRRYEVDLPGQAAPFALPEVHPRGIALRAFAEANPAGEPLRIAVAGRGDGPWLLGVFCRGVLVGQTTLRAGDDGELAATAEIELPAHASGVLRATVFDRTLQPVAERLLRREAAQRLDVAVLPQDERLVPGETQRLVLRATDERGQPVRAMLGVAVTDQAVAALGSEPRIGLADHATLFADVERVENLGDFLLGAADGARNADLLLGTRGWRRFVWRNDEAAQAAIAARGRDGEGVLAREGFSHTPQVVSNLDAAHAAGADLARDARQAGRRLRDAATLAVIALVLLLIGEGVAWILRYMMRWPPVLQAFGGVTVAAAAIVFAIVSIEPAVDRMAPPPGSRAIQSDFTAAGESLVRRFAAPVEEEERPFESSAWNNDVGLGGGRGGRFAGRTYAVRTQNERDVAAAPGLVRSDDEQAPVPDPNPVARTIVVFDHRERQYAHRHAADDARDDFTPTIFWNTLVPTDDRGEATVSFATSDAVTTWLVQVDAHALSSDVGRVGQGRGTFTTALPFHLDAKLPDEVSAGDELLLPIAAVADGQVLAEVALHARAAGGLRLPTGAPESIALDAGPGRATGRALVPLTAAHGAGAGELTIRGSVGRFTDVVRRELRIAPRGFPHRRSTGGTLAPGEPATAALSLPADAVPGSGSVLLKVYPSPISALTEGLEGILREPHGCFEQASSSNYPNTLVLTLLEANGDDVPTVAARARSLLPAGYAKITGYECSRRGYEWFGKDPGHEALTAYGLLQFHDMQKVHDVDAAMVDRTRQWLLARRDGKGNYPHDGKDHHSFGGRSVPLTNAYVTYALLQAGTPAAELATEVDALVRRAATPDPYELALVSCALHLAGRPEAESTRRALAALQRDDGSLHGTTTSITMSGGKDLVVETTGHAVLAWLPDPQYAAHVRRAVEFLQGSRDARGTWGATQATITALRALTAYAQQSRSMRSAGVVRVRHGDELLGERAFAAGAADAITFELWDRLAAGERTLQLEFDGTGDALPWAIDVAYHSELPADDAEGAVALRTALRAATVREGDTVALDVEVMNRTDSPLPMTLAVVGLPAGLELPTRVLEDLQKAEAFAFWELRGRELALYWRSLDVGATQRFTLDLVARIPGRSTGPASRARLYYTPEFERWAAPLTIEVAPR